MPSVVILTIAAVVGIPGSIAGAGLVGRGRPGAISTSLVVAAVVNLAAVVALVPSFGAMGAAVATLVGNLVAAKTNIFVLKRVYGMSFGAFYVIRRSDVSSIVNLVAAFIKPLKRQDSLMALRAGILMRVARHAHRWLLLARLQLLSIFSTMGIKGNAAVVSLTPYGQRTRTVVHLAIESTSNPSA